MRALQLAIHPLLEGAHTARERRVSRLWRPAFVASALVHVVGVYTLSRMSWVVDDVPAPPPTTQFLWLPELTLPPPSEAPALEILPAEVAPPLTEPLLPEPVVPAVTELPVVEPEIAPAIEPAVEPVVERAVEPLPLVPERAAELTIDFEAARQRAAEEVVEQRAREAAYLTFSIDDVAPPRPAAQQPARTIFDVSGGTRGPTVGQVGRARTRFGHRVTELCNALTGGFSLMGFGSFCAKGSDEPTGLFPEVRPEIMSLRPDCVETRPFAAALGEESPFPTVKCRLVPIDDPE